ncbi:MAG: hypothetical protein ACKPKO_58205 [Candidatus Fonsibacter sp.]
MPIIEFNNLPSNSCNNNPSSSSSDDDDDSLSDNSAIFNNASCSYSFFK